MNAGQLRHLVKVEKLVETQGAGGALSDTWVKQFETWARVHPVSGKEYFAQDKNQTIVTHKVSMRHDSNTQKIDEKYRIVFDGRVFDIESVLNPLEKDIRLELMCVVRDT